MGFGISAERELLSLRSSNNNYSVNSSDQQRMAICGLRNCSQRQKGQNKKWCWVDRCWLAGGCSSRSSRATKSKEGLVEQLGHERASEQAEGMVKVLYSRIKWPQKLSSLWKQRHRVETRKEGERRVYQKTLRFHAVWAWAISWQCGVGKVGKVACRG